ncbi:calmodulin-like protein containing EF hand domain, partial [Diplonema papillatum]
MPTSVVRQRRASSTDGRAPGHSEVALLVAADLYGKKHNLRFVFPTRPTIRELTTQVENAFQREAVLQLPDRERLVDFKVAHLSVFNSSHSVWATLTRQRQLDDGTQLYAFQQRPVQRDTFDYENPFGGRNLTPRAHQLSPTTRSRSESPASSLFGKQHLDHSLERGVSPARQQENANRRALYDQLKHVFHDLADEDSVILISQLPQKLRERKVCDADQLVASLRRGVDPQGLRGTSDAVSIAQFVKWGRKNPLAVNALFATCAGSAAPAVPLQQLPASSPYCPAGKQPPGTLSACGKQKGTRQTMSRRVSDVSFSGSERSVGLCKSPRSVLQEYESRSDEPSTSENSAQFLEEEVCVATARTEFKRYQQPHVAECTPISPPCQAVLYPSRCTETGSDDLFCSFGVTHQQGLAGTARKAFGVKPPSIASPVESPPQVRKAPVPLANYGRTSVVPGRDDSSLLLCATPVKSRTGAHPYHQQRATPKSPTLSPLSSDWVPSPEDDEASVASAQAYNSIPLDASQVLGADEPSFYRNDFDGSSADGYVAAWYPPTEQEMQLPPLNQPIPTECHPHHHDHHHDHHDHHHNHADTAHQLNQIRRAGPPAHAQGGMLSPGGPEVFGQAAEQEEEEEEEEGGDPARFALHEPAAGQQF